MNINNAASLQAHAPQFMRAMRCCLALSFTSFTRLCVPHIVKPQSSLSQCHQSHDIYSSHLYTIHNIQTSQINHTPQLLPTKKQKWRPTHPAPYPPLFPKSKLLCENPPPSRPCPSRTPTQPPNLAPPATSPLSTPSTNPIHRSSSPAKMNSSSNSKSLTTKRVSGRMSSFWNIHGLDGEERHRRSK
jgi:hypothetical protein